jgi:hypothetical protein
VPAAIRGLLMNHDDLIGAYRLAAAEHSQAQSRLERPGVVAQANRAADNMRRLATEIATAGSAAVRDFSRLLEDGQSGVQEWAAFHVLELMDAPSDVVDRAFEVLETRAKGEGVSALGIRMRLKELRSQFGR